MFGLFRPIPVYIRISRNRVELKRLDDGQYLQLETVEPFSSNRLILANYDRLYNLIEEMLLNSNRGIRARYKFIFQIYGDDVVDIAQTEKMCLNDLGLRLGSNLVFIVDDSTEPLTDEELKKIFRGK